MRRKDFIRLMGTGALAVVVLNQLGCSKSDSTPNKDFIIDLNAPENSSLLNIGGCVYVQSVIVFKATDGNFYALSQICTHQGCTVKFDQSLNDIVCPCHGSKFNIQGKIITGPATSSLFQYATSLSGTSLHVFSP